MNIDSDHVNYLVWRYLQESGFQHSAFTFGQESSIVRSSVAQVKIPPGALIAHLQRALIYVQAEVNLTAGGRPADLDDLDQIDALTLIESAQPDVCERRRALLRSRLSEREADGAGAAEGGAAAPADPPSGSKPKVLLGHENEVFACAWNPIFDLMASGSSDSTARIWSMDPAGLAKGEVQILRHFAPHGEDAKDVTSLEWSADGTQLATGSYDGAGRIWTRRGELQCRLSGHSGPVFALNWNQQGDLLVTSSVDQSVIVWESASGQLRQRFQFHTAPCLDVNWRDNKCFASCSQDQTIFVCQVGRTTPIKRYDNGTLAGGHTDEVNAIRWDPSAKYLASCSDDCTAKIWSLEMDSPLQSLKHDNKIYSLKWKPTAQTTPILASASFDHTTKIWDALQGTCLFTLRGHTNPVYSVDFSPDGSQIASGSFDKAVMVWSLETGRVTQSFTSGGGVFEVCWDKDGKRIAACCQDGTVLVVDATTR
mmetsp:Transcript_36662/g.96016  ORF Transcript_36662/g.96016 Transcript_36662/m.96016 type:complete len:482 (+) Transcript_36662:339-1784(+)